jgi:hypothetical protein
MKNVLAVALVAATATLAACTDSPSEPTLKSEAVPVFGLSPKAAASMSNYVAIGTSLSMGWASDGVVFTSQENSWPSQLADMARVPFTQPLIAAPGCVPPLAAPLGAFSRIDGSPATSSTVCAANVAGVTLATNNLAVENATAAEALNATSATASAGRGPVTSRVLPAGMTQLSTMESLNPSFVSVEFGGNEVLPAQVGLIYPGVTITPFATFSANYTQIINRVVATGADAVLVTLIDDLREFPTIRTGPEIAAQRDAFAGYNVSVNANCDESPNFIFVRGKVLTAIATAAFMAGHGLGVYNLSCADVPGTPDYVLTPADITYLNDLIHQMTALIETKASENGFAVFSLDALYGKSKNDVPFDLNAFLTSPTPYGPNISLDGVHPSAEGQKILARAASQAIQKTYGYGKP